MVDDVSQIGQTLVDHVCLLKQAALCASLFRPLTTSEIHEVQLAAFRAISALIILLDCDDETGVRTRRASIHIRSTDRTVLAALDHNLVNFTFFADVDLCNILNVHALSLLFTNF